MPNREFESKRRRDRKGRFANKPPAPTAPLDLDEEQPPTAANDDVVTREEALAKLDEIEGYEAGWYRYAPSVEISRAALSEAREAIDILDAESLPMPYVSASQGGSVAFEWHDDDENAPMAHVIAEFFPDGRAELSAWKTADGDITHQQDVPNCDSAQAVDYYKRMMSGGQPAGDAASKPPELTNADPNPSLTVGETMNTRIARAASRAAWVIVMERRDTEKARRAAIKTAAGCELREWEPKAFRQPGPAADAQAELAAKITEYLDVEGIEWAATQAERWA